MTKLIVIDQAVECWDNVPSEVGALRGQNAQADSVRSTHPAGHVWDPSWETKLASESVLPAGAPEQPLVEKKADACDEQTVRPTPDLERPVPLRLRPDGLGLRMGEHFFTGIAKHRKLPWREQADAAVVQLLLSGLRRPRRAGQEKPRPWVLDQVRLTDNEGPTTLLLCDGFTFATRSGRTATM